jgi:hypothetical protein
MKKVRANETFMEAGTTTIYIVVDKEYDVYSEFITEKMFSGICYVILGEDNQFHGLDANYFDEI